MRESDCGGRVRVCASGDSQTQTHLSTVRDSGSPFMGSANGREAVTEEKRERERAKDQNATFHKTHLSMAGRWFLI